MTYSKIIIGQLIGLAAYGLRLQNLLAVEEIVADGPWTNHDWLDADSGIGVEDGVPYGNTEDAQRRITSPQPLDGNVPAYMSKDNVQLVA